MLNVSVAVLLSATTASVARIRKPQIISDLDEKHSTGVFDSWEYALIVCWEWVLLILLWLGVVNIKDCKSCDNNELILLGVKIFCSNNDSEVKVLANINFNDENITMNS